MSNEKVQIHVIERVIIDKKTSQQPQVRLFVRRYLDTLSFYVAVPNGFEDDFMAMQPTLCLARRGLKRQRRVSYYDNAEKCWTYVNAGRKSKPLSIMKCSPKNLPESSNPAGFPVPINRNSINSWIPLPAAPVDYAFLNTYIKDEDSKDIKSARLLAQYPDYGLSGGKRRVSYAANAVAVNHYSFVLASFYDKASATFKMSCENPTILDKVDFRAGISAKAARNNGALYIFKFE